LIGAEIDDFEMAVICVITPNALDFDVNYISNFLKRIDPYCL